MRALPLSARGLCKFFYAGVAGCAARVRVLDRVSLDVRPGEIVGVVGQRGAGKSTLLLVAAGRLAPDAGTVQTERARLLLIDEPFATATSLQLDGLWRRVAHAAESDFGVLIASRQLILSEVVTRLLALEQGALRSVHVASPWRSPHARVAERSFR